MAKKGRFLFAGRAKDHNTGVVVVVVVVEMSLDESTTLYSMK